MRTRRWVWSLSVALLTLGVSGPALAQSDEERAGRGWLGVFTQSLTPGLREGLGYEGDGVLVRSVVQGSPADRAGIQQGDVILSVAGRRVDSPEELARVIRASEPGRSITMRIVRDGNSESITARLDRRPSDEDAEAPRAPRAPRAPEPPQPPEVPSVPELDRDLMIFPDEGGNLERMVVRGGPRLGVRVESLNDDLASALNLEETKGVLVVEVMNDTPAERGGLKGGDVIIRVGDRDTEDVDGLMSALRESERDTRVTVVRNGSSRTFDVKLGEAPSTQHFDKSFDKDLGKRFNMMRGNRVFERRGGNAAGPELRRELEGLKRELEELRRELEELRRN